MVVFVVDKSLDLLRDQVDAAAPGRSKASDGSIGDPDHAARTSAHNPEDTEDSSDGNDPDNQVDARDITHDPDSGADMHVVTESIRQSRDRRVHLVIFNKRIFSSYSTASRRAWEWGPYSGSNDHSKHAHVEANDLYNDTLTPWKIGIDMAVDISDASISKIITGVWGAALGTGANRRSTGAILQDAADESDIPVGDVDEQALADALAPELLEEIQAGLGELVRRIVREELDKTKTIGTLTS